MGLLGGQARYRDRKFLVVWESFEPAWLTRDEAWELAVVLATPGFTFEQHVAAFAWTHIARNRAVRAVQSFFEGDPTIVAAASANACSMALRDGTDWLMGVSDLNRWWPRTVPTWSALAVQSLWRDEGWSVASLARQFRVSPGRMRQWLDQSLVG